MDFGQSLAPALPSARRPVGSDWREDSGWSQTEFGSLPVDFAHHWAVLELPEPEILEDAAKLRGERRMLRPAILLDAWLAHQLIDSRHSLLQSVTILPSS